MTRIKLFRKWLLPLLAATVFILAVTLSGLLPLPARSSFAPGSAIPTEAEMLEIATPDWAKITLRTLPAILKSGSFQAPENLISILGYDPSRSWEAGQTANQYMIRDLGDIQMPNFWPFVTNAQLSLPLPDGRQLKTAHKSHRRELAALMDAGQLGDYDAIFTTYSQLQTIKGKETERRQFLRRFAPNAILILDESHEAGGSRSERATPGAAPNRADFVRELIGLAAGAVYSSATYAKRPDVMDLYAKTDMRR